MGSCCCTPPPDPPPLGACCFTEIVNTEPKSTGAARQNQGSPYDVLNNGDPVGSLDAAITALSQYLQAGVDLGYFYDVNGDGFITANDLLILINFRNFLQSNPRSQGNICEDNVTEAQCFASFRGIGFDSSDFTSGQDTLFKRYNHRFKANQSCGEQVSCPNVPSITYNTACGEVDCPGYYCNQKTGECGLRNTIDSSLLSRWPYSLVDNCEECEKTNPGCCCKYWTDPEGKIPDYNNVTYVFDDYLCKGRRIFHVNQYITPDAYFASKEENGFSIDENSNFICDALSPCNGDDPDDDDDTPVSGWYCLEQFNSGNKFCQFFNRDPKEEGFIDTEVKGGPFQEKSICDENCGGGGNGGGGGGGGGDDDDPHPPADQGYVCLSMDKNGLSDIVLTNHCNVDPFTIDVSVHRFKYDKTGKAGPVSIEVVALRQNVELLSGTVNFPTPDIVNEEFTQTIPFTLTLPRDFSTGEYPLFVQLRNPTNGAKISSFTCRLEIKVVIPDDCPFCCKDDAVIATNISPCDCFALGGECSNTNDCGTPRDDLGRCCYGPSGCDPPCPEDFICEEGITKRDCDEKIFSINGFTFPTIRDFSKGETCDSDPCYTTTTTTTTPSPCSCAEAGKIDCEENINEDGCIFVYNSSTDSFSLTSNCPDGASCLDYDVDCFRTPALSNGDLFGKPCCCTTPPPASSKCDYCCVDPDGEGSTTLTSAECAALKGVCINSGDLPAYTASSAFEDVAKSYCNTNSCDPITGYLVRYEGSGVHTPNSQSYTIPASGNVNFRLYSGLLHDKSVFWNNLDSGNCPVKVTLKKDGATVCESPYFGDPSYQAELDAALGSSNPISAWRGVFYSGVMFDGVGTLGVEISSPLDCGEKSTWSYNATCPYNCINSVVNNLTSDPHHWLVNGSIVGDFAPAFERRFAHVINSDGFLNFDLYPNLGYNPDRLFDFDTDSSTYAHIQDYAVHFPYTAYQFKTVMIGQQYRHGNYRDCGIGTNYFHKTSKPHLYPNSALGELNAFWRLGTPPDVEIKRLDTIAGSQTFRVDTVMGHRHHPKTFYPEFTYSYSISNTLTSNSCEPGYVWIDPDAKYLKWHDSDAVSSFLKNFRRVHGTYPRGACGQADLMLHVKQEGNLCYRKYIPSSGERVGTHCSYDFIDFKIGCITVHSQDKSDQTLPDDFDFYPTHDPAYHHLYLTSEVLQNSDSYQDCSCFATMCCDGSDVKGECYENVSEETCDCKIGNGLYDPTLQEIFDNPCNPIFTNFSSIYTHWNGFFNIQPRGGLGMCTSTPTEVPEITDYQYPIEDGFWSYPSCGEIKRICAGEDLSGGGGGI